jgi:hypothetical protein
MERKSGSGINIPDPQHWNEAFIIVFTTKPFRFCRDWKKESVSEGLRVLFLRQQGELKSSVVPRYIWFVDEVSVGGSQLSLAQPSASVLKEQYHGSVLYHFFTRPGHIPVLYLIKTNNSKFGNQ